MDDDFAAWQKVQPDALRGDVLWKLDTYRLALYLGDLVRGDVRRAKGDEYSGARNQLLACVSSISANIAEGYSRPTPGDRARFYGYALGSTRESITWYASIRDAIGDEIVFARYRHLARIRRLLIAIQKSIHSKLPPGAFTP